MKKMIGTIDLTPTWSEQLQQCLMIIENTDDAAAQLVARNELKRIGELADGYVALQNDPVKLTDDMAMLLKCLVGTSEMYPVRACSLIGKGMFEAAEELAELDLVRVERGQDGTGHMGTAARLHNPAQGCDNAHKGKPVPTTLGQLQKERQAELDKHDESRDYLRKAVHPAKGSEHLLAGIVKHIDDRRGKGWIFISMTAARGNSRKVHDAPGDACPRGLVVGNHMVKGSQSEVWQFLNA